MGKRSDKGWSKRIHAWNRGLRERNSQFRITPEFVSKFKSCKYCSIDLDPINAGLDHQDPLSRGGKDEETNLVIICKVCNRAKSSFDDAEFGALLNCLNKPPFTQDMKLRLLRKLRVAWRIQ